MYHQVHLIQLEDNVKIHLSIETNIDDDQFTKMIQQDLYKQNEIRSQLNIIIVNSHLTSYGMEQSLFNREAKVSIVATSMEVQ